MAPMTQPSDIAINEEKEILIRYSRREKINRRYRLQNPSIYFAYVQRNRRLLKVLRNVDLSNKTLLEVGCGAANNLRDFLSWGCQAKNIYGIELNEERVNVAQERFPNFHIQKGNAKI